MYKTYFPVLDAILEDMRGNGAFAVNEGLNAFYLHTVEVQRSLNTVYAAGKQAGVDIETDRQFDALELAIASYSRESERQGFINGFRAARLFMCECSGVVPADAGFLGSYDFPGDKAKDAGVYECYLRDKER